MEGNSSRLIFILQKLSPWTYYNQQTNNLAFKTLLAFECLTGAFILAKIYLFGKRINEGYKLQALSDQKKQAKAGLIAETFKKYIKKSEINKEVEKAVLTMGLSELQKSLLKQYLQNPDNETHAISIQDVILIYLKQALTSDTTAYSDPTRLTQVVEEAQELNRQISEMIISINDIIAPIVKQQPIQEDRSSLIQEEELKEEAPQASLIIQGLQINNEKKPHQLILQQKPLLGLVYACSDSIKIEGTFSSRGTIEQSNVTNSDNCDLINQMTAFGAIQLLKANTSQANIPFNDAQNLLWSQSSNPWNNMRIAGSSSEASMVALRIVNFAIAEDLLGEQLINSMFNGVYALSVSPKRLSSEMLDSQASITESQFTGPKSVIKPRVCLIGKKVEDITIVLDTLFSSSNENKLFQKYPQCLDMGFDQKKLFEDKSLRIGFYDEFSAQSMKRAILLSCGHFASMGHELVKIPQLPFYDEILELSLKLYFNMNFTAQKSFIDRVEEHNSDFKDLLFQLNGNFQSHHFFNKILLRYASSRQITIKNGIKRINSAQQLMESLSKLENLKQQAIQELKKRHQCDIFLCPVFPTVAPPKNVSLNSLIAGFGLTLYWHMLGMPSGVVPVTQVNIDEASYKDSVNDSFTHYADQAMANSGGMPVGVQIIGGLNQDETVLKIMKELQDKVKFKLQIKFRGGE